MPEETNPAEDEIIIGDKKAPNEENKSPAPYSNETETQDDNPSDNTDDSTKEDISESDGEDSTPQNGADSGNESSGDKKSSDSTAAGSESSNEPPEENTENQKGGNSDEGNDDALTPSDNADDKSESSGNESNENQNVTKESDEPETEPAIPDGNDSLRTEAYKTYLRKMFNRYENDDFNGLLNDWRKDTSGVDDNGNLNENTEFIRYMKENGRPYEKNRNGSPTILTYEEFLSMVYTDRETMEGYFSSSKYKAYLNNLERFFHEFTFCLSAAAYFPPFKISALTKEEAITSLKRMLKENKAPLRISDISRLADLHGEIRWDVTDKDGLVAKNIYNYGSSPISVGKKLASTITQAALFAD